MKLSPDKQINSYFFMHKNEYNEVDTAIVECIRLGYLIFDPLNDLVKITNSGRRYLRNIERNDDIV